MREITEGYRPEYGLDLITPARIALTALEEARLNRRAFPTVIDLAENYAVAMGSDLNRVRDHEKCAGHAEAKRWIFTYIFRQLDLEGTAVQTADGAWRFADGIEFADARWNDRTVGLWQPPARFEKLSRFFNPMTAGENAGEARWETRTVTDDDTQDKERTKGSKSANLNELRESLRNGWDAKLGGPIIKDSRGVTLAGRRRERLLKELGKPLPPEGKGLVTLDLSDTDADNLERWRILAASNTGTSFTKEERQELIKLLADEKGVLPKGVTQTNLATALGVTQQWISKDLEALGITTNCNSQGPSDSRSKTSKRGRPAGSKNRSKGDDQKLSDELVDRCVQLHLSNQSIPRAQLAEEFGVGVNTVQQAGKKAEGIVEERERIKAEAVAEALEAAEQQRSESVIEPQPEPEASPEDQVTDDEEVSGVWSREPVTDAGPVHEHIHKSMVLVHGSGCDCGHLDNPDLVKAQVSELLKSLYGPNAKILMS